MRVQYCRSWTNENAGYTSPDIWSYLAALVTGLLTLPPEATGSTPVVRLVDFTGKLRLLLVVPEVKGVSFTVM